MMREWVSRLVPNSLAKALRGTVRTKLAIFVTLLIGIIALFILLYFPTRLENQAIKNLVDKADTIGAMASHSISEALLSDDATSVMETLDRIRPPVDFDYLVVLDNSRQIVAAFNRDGAEQADFREVTDVSEVLESGSIYKSKTTIQKDGKVIGELYMGLGLEVIKAEISASRTTIALVSLMVFVIGWIAVEFYSVVLTLPLNRTIETINGIAAGDLTRRVAVTSDDELGNLAKSFNLMLDKVQATYTQMEESAIQLEKRVEKRTQELQQEIDERKQTEQQLQQAYSNLRRSHQELEATQLNLIQAEKLESIGQLAAGVAHEVKNPLMTILIGVKYLSKHIPTDDDNVAQLLEDMEDAVNRANTVITDLLNFSRPKDLDRTVEDVNLIVDRGLSLVKHDLARFHVEVVKALGGDLPPLMMDSQKIQQVLIIIFTNAIHAMPEGGTLTVKTYGTTASEQGGNEIQSTADADSQEDLVILEIEDTGTGIPEDAVGKVFDPFFSTKPTGYGTGLGLSVAYQIIKMHRGTLDITNRTEGGVKVTVTLKTGTDRRRIQRAN